MAPGLYDHIDDRDIDDRVIGDRVTPRYYGHFFYPSETLIHSLKENPDIAASPLILPAVTSPKFQPGLSFYNFTPFILPLEPIMFIFPMLIL